MVLQIVTGKRFSDVVNLALARKNMNNTQFAKKMNLSTSHAHALLKNKRRWHEEAMILACDVLGITIEYKIS